MPIEAETGERNAEFSKLNLHAEDKLAAILGVTVEQLKDLSAKAGSYYEPFEKKHRKKPFQRKFAPPRKRPRIIDNPKGNLKELQKRINDRILKPITLPHYLCGGVPGKSILDNVSMHLGESVLVTIDIKNFFRRISNIQVYEVWTRTLGCSGNIAAILTRLTTFQRHLPQGAPTSSLLANLVLYSADAPIRVECAKQRVNYSTWVDDLAFSGRGAREVLPTAISSLRAAGFAVPHSKQKIMGPGTRKLLNGVLINRFPNVLPETISRLRSGIHKLSTGQVTDTELDRYVRQLKGRIAYVASIAPHRADKLTCDLSAALRATSGRSRIA